MKGYCNFVIRDFGGVQNGIEAYNIILSVHSAAHNKIFCTKYLESVKPKQFTISLQQIFIIIIPFVVLT